MINLITKILSLAIVVSKTTEHDVFFRYSPHCNSISGEIYKGGWKHGVNADFEYRLFMDNAPLEANIKRLYEIKKKIEELSNE